MVVSASDARRAALLRWGAGFAVWAALWHLACRYEWGLVYVIVTAFLFIFTVGLGKGTRKADGFSAWSVFNTNHERLLGTTTAQQFENEIMRRAPNAENRRWDGDGQQLGGGGGGGDGGGGDAFDELLGADRAQEERDFQEALRRSMLHTRGAEAPARGGAAAAGANPKKAGKRARKEKRAAKAAKAAAADAARRERLAAAAERRWEEEEDAAEFDDR